MIVPLILPVRSASGVRLGEWIFEGLIGGIFSVSRLDRGHSGLPSPIFKFSKGCLKVIQSHPQSGTMLLVGGTTLLLTGATLLSWIPFGQLSSQNDPNFEVATIL